MIHLHSDKLFFLTILWYNKYNNQERVECKVDALDLSSLTPTLFIVAVIFIMLIGTAVSLGVIRAFQQQFRPMLLLFISAILLTLILIFVLRTWF
jgi:hypothetical protein